MNRQQAATYICPATVGFAPAGHSGIGDEVGTDVEVLNSSSSLIDCWLTNWG